MTARVRYHTQEKVCRLSARLLAPDVQVQDLKQQDIEGRLGFPGAQHLMEIILNRNKWELE